MLLTQALKDFLEVHRIDIQSQRTIENYQVHISEFIEWLAHEQGVTNTEDLKVTHLRAWIAHLQTTPSKQKERRADSTIHIYGMCMVAFCHWLEAEEYVPQRITTRFKLPRIEKKFIPTFTAEEVKKLFDACEETERYILPNIRKAISARNRAILAVFLDSGIRLSELLNLRLKDVDKDLRVLVVHRKGNK